MRLLCIIACASLTGCAIMQPLAKVGKNMLEPDPHGGGGGNLAIESNAFWQQMQDQKNTNIDPGDLALEIYLADMNPTACDPDDLDGDPYDDVCPTDPPAPTVPPLQ